MAECDLGHSHKHNWVDEVGGLPSYIHSVACSLVKSGHDVSSAIAIAVSRMKVWAATGDADTKAKAGAALAEWEAKKAKSHSKRARVDRYFQAAPDSCEVCASYDGRIWTKVLFKGYDLPHPNCKCETIDEPIRSTNMAFETRGAKLTSYDPEKHQVAARAITYNLVDDHGTEFAPGCFADSLRAGSVKSVWSHDAKRPIGKVIDHRDSNEGLDVIIQLADIDAVQDARMAHALLKDDIVNQFSVGFIRQTDTNDGERITKADLVEISPVLRGSNPGTRTLAVRSTTRAEASDLLNQVMLGEITAEDALSQLSEEPAQRESVTIPMTEYRSLMEKAGISPEKDENCCTDTEAEFRAIDDLFNEDWN